MCQRRCNSTRTKHVRVRICHSGSGRTRSVPCECHEHFLPWNFAKAGTGDMERSRIQRISQANAAFHSAIHWSRLLHQWRRRRVALFCVVSYSFVSTRLFNRVPTGTKNASGKMARRHTISLGIHQCTNSTAFPRNTVFVLGTHFLCELDLHNQYMVCTVNL